ncbi:MAG TPA: sigma-70 family RNA polymerase sigma factor [Solirubrobacteraceae bacterium]|nr:sigma-70 family RNA polymerase sigma factor [Solirubrobacteraceae bacterium]
MDDSQGDRTRTTAAEELILRTIAAHAESLLRTARRHSICADDAQDAYQRAIEIFMTHAQRLDAGRAAGWLHVVVKREAQAIMRSRQKLLTTTEVDLDGHVAASLASPEEQLLRFDMISRSAEALKRLKPHELRALWLRAQGHSYSDIGAITGWSYSKVNRCLTEGRRAFLERYDGIESGAECARWLPVLSAIVDGEATSEQLLELRPHLRNCPGCRATLKSLQDSSRPLGVLLPGPLVVVDGTGDHVVTMLIRLYEGMAGGLHERAVNSLTKTQALIEASASGKVAAMAASAAAVAGGGYASAERVVEHPPAPRAAASARAHVHSTGSDAKVVANLSTAAGAGAASAVRVARQSGLRSLPRRNRAPAVSRVFASAAALAPETRARTPAARSAFAAQASARRSSAGWAPPPPPTSTDAFAPERSAAAFAPSGG